MDENQDLPSTGQTSHSSPHAAASTRPPPFPRGTERNANTRMVRYRSRTISASRGPGAALPLSMQRVMLLVPRIC
jgi:hypothetical protein